jgi:hypothetical protein
MNFNRCRLAQELMYQYACEMNAVLISEPHKQHTHWYNDTKGVTSIRVTLFNGRHAAEEMFVGRDDLGETYSLGSYQS